MYAYKMARGDCAIQLDCDLQDPPELIPQMLDLWRQGNQVVYGIRKKLPDTDDDASPTPSPKLKMGWGLPLDRGALRL